MKKFILCCLVVFTAMQASSAIKIACVGDSITYGAGIKDRVNFSYPQQLQYMLGSNYQVTNYGVNGRTLLKKGNLPYWKTGQYKQALKSNPDIVIIKLGTNDTKMANWQHKADLEKDLSDLADSFSKLPSKPLVYLALPVPAFLNGNNIDGERIKLGIIPIIKKVAKKKNLPIIDFYSLMLSKSALFPDKVHPNAQGAFELAAKSFAIIRGVEYGETLDDLKNIVKNSLPGSISNWHGFKIHKFRHNKVSCFIVAPKRVALGKPWIWRARFFGHEPQTDIALLKRGFHVVYCDVSNLFGSPKAIKRWDDFYEYVTTELGFAKKVSLEGMSRGGFIIFNWATKNTEKINAIYGDAPVCDFKSWPAGSGKSVRSQGTWNSCLKAYDFKDEKSAMSWVGNPVDNAVAIAKAKIPVMIVYGKSDEIVPASENCLIFEKNFRSAGGDIIMIGKDNCGHHPHSLKNPEKIVEFILKHSNLSKDNKNIPIKIRSGLGNSYDLFRKEKSARVAFLGGSITEMEGWRNHVAKSLEKRFPKTKFDFVFAGIGSTDSTMGAFRITKDIFKKGKIDLLFIESAVNEVHNGRTKREIYQATEGIIRNAFNHNQNIDIIAQYFSDKYHLKNLRSGNMSWQIKELDAIAKHYNISAINHVVLLDKAVKAGEITEKEFARDGCHPSPKGHLLYAKNINTLFDKAFSCKAIKKSLPVPLWEKSYQHGTNIDISKANIIKGWKYISKWKPLKGNTRKQFVNLPILEATTPGAVLTLDFSGTAIGIVIPAGFDAGIIEYKVDDGEFKTMDLFTRWSSRLHIPWIYMLEGNLSAKKHCLTLRMSDKKNSNSTGTACRICYFAVSTI